MHLLRRHILRTMVAPFLFSLAALTGMMMINQIARKFGELVGKDLPWTVIVEVLALFIPFIIALTLPMAVLVAVLYGFSQLGSDNEITAMRASGVSVMQMLRPALMAGAVLAIANFFFVDQILPRTNARLRNLQTDIARKKPAFQMREQAVNELRPYFISAGRIFPGSGRLRDVMIYDMSILDGRRVIYADSGFMVFERNGVDLSFQLYHGKVHEYKYAEPARVQTTEFLQNTIRVKDVQNMLTRSPDIQRGDREMTTCEMMDQVSSAQRTLAHARAMRADLVEQDLRTLMKLMQSGVSPPVEGGSVQHCGKWKKVENFIGRLLLPELAQAQIVVQARVQDTVKAKAPASAPDTVKKLADTTKKPSPDTAKKVVPAIQPAAAVPPPAQAGDTTHHHDSVPAPHPPAVVPPPLQVVTGTAATASPDAPVLTGVPEGLSARQDEFQAQRNAAAYEVEIHKKYSISVACFTFVLIGVPLALRFPRGGMGLVIGGGSVLFALFYVSLNNGESLADRGFVSPAVAMWFPNLVVLVAGIIGLIRVNREFGSTRGGDLAELFDAIRGLFRRKRAEG